MKFRSLSLLVPKTSTYIAYRQCMMGIAVLVLLLVGCSSAPTKTVINPPIIAPSQTASIAPAKTPTQVIRDGELSITSPKKSTQISGGSGLRIAFDLADHDDLPIEGALVQAMLWTPAGEYYASLPGTDQGDGRYLTDNIHLPLRDSAGSWRVVGQAFWNNSKQADVEGTIAVDPSVSEMYQNLYGFWINQPQFYGLGTGFYNLSQSGGLHFEDQLNEDGSGYVLLDNYRYGAIGVTFAALEIHWQDYELPIDAVSAAAYAQTLVGSGLPHQDPDAPIMELKAEQVSFQDRPAWQVSGSTREYYVSKAAAEYPVEWLMFTCPRSDWLWTLVISTDQASYMSRLRTLLATFECPSND
jgi:hypothetical protein